MKGILFALLVIAVILFVTVESRTGEPKKQGCVSKNCARCDDRQRRRLQCQECKDGFAKVTYMNQKRAHKNKTICEPCGKQTPRNGKQVIDRDVSKCPTEPPCPRNCASCNNGKCTECSEGFALVDKSLKRSCVPCRRRKTQKLKIVDESQCPAMCAKGCLNCTDGNCTECKDGFELNLGTNQCEKVGCGRGCLNCSDSGTCAECKKGFTLSRNRKRCIKRKQGKRKGGKRRPKTTPKP